MTATHGADNGTDNGTPNAARSSARQGVDETVLTYPDGTQLLQRFTNGPAPAGSSTGSSTGPSVTVSGPRPRTVEGHLRTDGRFWRVDVPELDMDVPVRLQEHAAGHAAAFVAERLQIDPSLVTVRLLRNGQPFTPPAPQRAPAPPPRPTITYR